jgi:multiple sugar transport system substrate-binding protein
MIEIQEFYPPGGKNFSLSDVIFSFGGGQTALHANWDDGFIQAMEKESPIRNKVNATMAPGAKKAWNRKTKKWDDFPDINRAPYLAWGGWITGVPKTSKNKEAAFDFLGFLSNNANQQHDLTVGRYGVNPYRTNDFNPDFWVDKAGFDPEVAKGYTDALRNTLDHPSRVFDLRIPGNQLYVNALATAVSEALAGKLKPQEALDKAAKEWDKITHRVGFDQQKGAYQEIVNLEGK